MSGDAARPRTARISLTDRCDLACIYCRPSRNDGYLTSRLDGTAFRRLLEGLARAGVRRVRLTGGEPLLHPDVVDLVAQAAELGFDDLAMTTNATRLSGLADPLRRAGLHRLNVSLDSLARARFTRITRGGDLDTVLDGIDAAAQAGFRDLKINCVVVRGENDDEIEAITEWAWRRRITPRFIELMPIGEGARLGARSSVPSVEVRARIANLLSDEAPAVDTDRGPARYVRGRRDARLRVGFISGASETPCAGCDRLRVSADGILRPCLASAIGVAAGPLARTGDDAGLARAVERAWQCKPDPSRWKGCAEPEAATLSIRAIGG